MPTTRLLAVMLITSACASAPAPAPTTTQPTAATTAPFETTAQPAAAPTAAQAAAFVDSAAAVLFDLTVRSDRAEWVQNTFITYDTELLAAQAKEKLIAASVDLAKKAARFNDVPADSATRRQLNLLRLALTTPAPGDAAKTAEVARLAAALTSKYGAGKYCPAGKSGDDCLDLEELSAIIAKSRNPDSLLMAWRGWHSISPPMRADYQRFVQLTNEGARELGFADAGEMWRSGYDMPPAAFGREVDRLWEQVRPLYNDLHCYVRGRLTARYGPQVAPPTGPIPAHLLGNMWAQEWGNIFDLVAPRSSAPTYDLTALLKRQHYTPQKMVKTGEGFFTSLGQPALPATFWERSLFVKPRDRDVVCHASAWDVDAVEDLRIKMCINISGEDFQTIHHELGHNFYQRAYNGQPYLFRNSANDGFHEALGDAIALSVTPQYLVKIGLLAEEPATSSDIPLLLAKALDKVAFLPFGLLVDQWRWQVFSGQIPPDKYNQAWWALREKYQGVSAPAGRSEADFDPGAKFHVAANVPYTRYFLAAILQFQFHRALCEAAGFKGPLNRCSIYGSAEAGRRLDAMMRMGASRPWPEALAALTGSAQMDATAILDYFAPLKSWLEEQNRGKQCGW
ncbi:MAG TPA: M2 family metallopeptidase [Longimicrobiales bacterium]